MGARAGAVGDIHRIGEIFQRLRLGEQLVTIACDWRRDLGGNHEPAGSDRFLQVAAVGLYGHFLLPRLARGIALADAMRKR